MSATGGYGKTSVAVMTAPTECDSLSVSHAAFQYGYVRRVPREPGWRSGSGRPFEHPHRFAMPGREIRAPKANH